MKRVLVVDDDAHIRRLAKFVLLDAGFDVSLAGDGEEALEVIEQEHPEVVVLDVNMPVLDGRETFARMQTMPGRPPVLIMSADRAEKTQRDLGAEGSLPKPFSPEGMVQKVTALFRSAVAAA